VSYPSASKSHRVDANGKPFLLPGIGGINCLLAGHGPGVATLLASTTPIIGPKISKTANLGRLLRIGRFRPKPKARKKAGK